MSIFRVDQEVVEPDNDGCHLLTKGVLCRSKAKTVTTMKATITTVTKIVLSTGGLGVLGSAGAARSD